MKNVKNLDLKIKKKDGTLQPFDMMKVVNAANKSAKRALRVISDEEFDFITGDIAEWADNYGNDIIPVEEMHSIVEETLEVYVPTVAHSYREYRNSRKEWAEMMDEVYQEAQSIKYLGDKENANTDSSLVSTQRSLVYNALNKKLYIKFHLNNVEKQAISDGYIYIHDMNARRDTMNCCLFDIESVLSGGFEMGNVWYNEPKTADTAFDVIGDIVLSAASQQYGGFTIPEVDKILEKYVIKTYEKCLSNYHERCHMNLEEAEKLAEEDTIRQIEQGFQGWEYKFNTVGSSRGDYPFITCTFGLNQTKWGQLINLAILKVRKEGQGKEGHKKPVLFPKLVFLYDENLHGEGKPLYHIYEAGVECSQRAMYPDWLSLTGEGYVPSIYKKYGKVISPMGCRAFLSPWFEKGGMHPIDNNDEPRFIGRFNIGAISLNLPMILAKANQESRDFYEVLDYYLELIRGIHKKTYEYLGELKAGTNPLGFCEGGFYGGNLKPNQKLKESPVILPSATASFGVTALNELQRLYNGKSLVEDGLFALTVMQYIQDYVNLIKEEDHNLYAIYGTPAESLCGKQVIQFRKKYGIIPNVSDREFVSNSFHCHVSENIMPTQKQDLEERFWNYFNGGKIQYVRYNNADNKIAFQTLINRAMEKGFYEGVNLSLAYCENCGHEELNMDVCPCCGSRDLTKIERMNGYLSYSRVHGDTRLNAAKMAEIAERKSM